MISNIYKKIVIDFSKITLFLIFLILSCSLYYAKNFNLDASSDALILEGDKDLKYLREINERYGSKDFLFLTYSPVLDFSNSETIINLEFLKSKINKLSWVESVVTINDVPLLQSTEEPLMERLKNYKTLSHPDIDKKRGFEEILNSPIYKDYVISEDGKTSGIVIYIKKDKKLNQFIKIKNDYFKQINKEGLNKKEKVKYNFFLKEYEQYKNTFNTENHKNINEIRNIIDKYGEDAKIHLGGIPMIADDMMTYIKKDIIVFGIGVFLFIILTLWLVFRNIKWVLIPLLGCSVSVSIMVGLLGLLGWKVTVISSNFIALMLILNMAMNIHLTVRFLQLKKELPELSNIRGLTLFCGYNFMVILGYKWVCGIGLLY